MKPLDGIKVVELGTHVVIPTAARMMADWGADVIKVEAPGGDAWRARGSSQGLPWDADCNPMYAFSNSGKRFVSLNLKSAEGKEAMLRLLETADIFLTSVRLGGIERMGLDFDTLHERFPRLIYMHFTGFGYDGPEKDRIALDTNAFWAMSGTMHELHRADTAPGPTPPPGYGDTASCGNVLSGILAALYWREKSGEGVRLTSSLYANGIWCNHFRIIGRQEREDVGFAPVKAAAPAMGFTGIYECADGEWFAVVGNTFFGKDPVRYLKAFGLDECVDDPRYAVPRPEPDAARELREKIIESFKKKTSKEWDEIMTKADVPHSKLEHSRDVSKSEQAWANGYVGRMVCPDGRAFVLPNNPVTFYGLENSKTQHAGPVGADTRAVLAEYGYTDEEIQAMIDKGAVHQA